MMCWVGLNTSSRQLQGSVRAWEHTPGEHVVDVVRHLLHPAHLEPPAVLYTATVTALQQ